MRPSMHPLPSSPLSSAKEAVASTTLRERDCKYLPDNTDCTKMEMFSGPSIYVIQKCEKEIKPWLTIQCLSLGRPRLYSSSWLGWSWGSHPSPNKDCAKESVISGKDRSTGGQGCVWSLNLKTEGQIKHYHVVWKPQISHCVLPWQIKVW